MRFDKNIFEVEKRKHGLFDEDFEVEKEIFEVRFEGYHERSWISITKRIQGVAFSMAFEREEIGWLLKHSKKALEPERHLGFNKKFREETRTHFLEICFNSRGRFIKLLKFATN